MTSRVLDPLSISRIVTWAALALSVVLTPALVMTQSAHAQNFKTLYTFTGGADGAEPRAALIRDSAGNGYGTTLAGGHSYGTVFKVNKRGQEEVLHSFNGVDGGIPVYGSLLLDEAGNLYGTATSGGLPGCPNDEGCGVVFKLDTAGKYSVLYKFTGGADGGDPTGLVRDAAGNLYGATTTGGLCCGVVFKLDTAGNYSVLYKFTGGADGGEPVAGLVRDAANNLYGTTWHGGLTYGTVFKLNQKGQEKVLHSFTWDDGAYPQGGLLRDEAGNLYGTAAGGAIPGCTYDESCGVVFKLDAAGNYSVLYKFTGGADGGQPFGRLVRDAAGNLYGTNISGGDLTCFLGEGCGVVFKLDPTGHTTVLHTFTGGADGRWPFAGLLPAAGNFYGTTAKGGAFGNGTVFRLTP